MRQLRICPLTIPMRFRFEHAAAARESSDSVIVQVAGASPFAHLSGHGETLARAYVTGESAATVVEDVEAIFAPLLTDFRPTSFAEALEFIDALPFEHENRLIAAARAAVELALIDLAGQAFRRRAADVAGWLGLPGFGAPGCLRTARYSGIVLGRQRRKLTWLLRGQRAYGLRDFKIKVATPGWEERLEWTHAVLRSALASGRATLRADANAGWTLAEAFAALPLLEHCGVSVLEQPLSYELDQHLPALAKQARCQLMVDESLLAEDDARRLVADGGVRIFNVRLAKNGGLMPALRIARIALAAGLDVQLGCLVGETSVLTAAGLAFLEAVPSVRFIEGAYGRILLRDDVTPVSLRFGVGGKLRARPGFGLGVDVDDDALLRLAGAPVKTVHF